MSQVVEFYMTPADEEQFVTALNATGDVVVVLNTPELIELDISSLRESVNVDGYASLSLMNKAIESKIAIGSAGQDRYSIDVSESEGVKLSRWTLIQNDGKTRSRATLVR